MVTKTLKWKCEKCGKVIESLWEAQFKQNKEAHMSTHEDE